jgi:Tfp pilus assembly protein PilO
MGALSKIPFWMVFFLYLVYAGYQWFSFEISDSGEIAQLNQQLIQSKQEVDELKSKLSEGEKFVKNLDAKKDDIRQQVKKLADYQGVLADNLDVPALIKMLITETKRIKLRVERIEPGRNSPKEYYLEQEFKLAVHGTYVQMVLLAQRISQLQRILKLESFKFKPLLDSYGKPNGVLDATISIIAYQYSVSNEDSIARSYR